MQLGQVLSMITQKVNTMTEAGDLDKIYSKRKPLVALLLYAIWQEQHGQPEMFDMLVRITRAPGMLRYTWRLFERGINPLSKATPHAIVFISPSIFWGSYSLIAHEEDQVQRWAAATSVVQYTEEAAQNVVDALLQIVSLANTSSCTPHITTGVWSWLIKQPTLPPICKGRSCGTSRKVVRMVQGLGNTEILKSYLLLVWSEWDQLYPDGFEEMCVSVREDFCGVGMGHHRGDLIQRLDHILRQLDQGLGYLKQHNPDLREEQVQAMEHQYQQLREILLEINIQTIACKLTHPTIILSCMLIRGV